MVTMSQNLGGHSFRVRKSCWFLWKSESEEPGGSQPLPPKLFRGSSCLVSLPARSGDLKVASSVGQANKLQCPALLLAADRVFLGSMS